MKLNILGKTDKKDVNGRAMGSKHNSHSTFRAKRKPNSKRVRNGSTGQQQIVKKD